METAIAPAAPAAPVAAPVSAPVSAPEAPVIESSSPVAPVPVVTPAEPSGPVSALDRSSFGSHEAYAEALLAEQMAKVAEIPPEVEVDATPAEAADTPETPETQETPAETPEETPEFDLNPTPVMTPEALSQMITDNPEFGKLLKDNPKLNGQLFKTAREAAELRPYKQFFPDLEAAKDAAEAQRAHTEIKRTFLGSTTKEGTKETLAKMMEMSYERDEDGQVVLNDGKPVVGDDFFGFVDNVVALDMEKRREDVQARLEANQYHVGAKSEQERDERIARDQARLAHLDELLGEVVEPESQEDLPEHIRRREEDLNRREAALNQKSQGSKEEQRTAYEKTVVAGAQERVNKSIETVIASALKSGAVISPYLLKTLPKSMGDDLVQKLKADTALESRMLQLQMLPPTEKSRIRRWAEVDRAIHQYLPSIAIQHLSEAGIQMLNSSQAKAAKVGGQIARTNATEPKGSTAATHGQSSGPMTPEAADKVAMAEWKAAHPGKPFDGAAKELYANRVMQLMLQA